MSARSSSEVTPRYEPLERLRVPRPVERIRFVADACRGKDVLDLGALDESAVTLKRGRGTWLHEAIAGSASRVIGLDSSHEVPEGGLATARNARILRGDVLDLEAFLTREGFAPNVVVAGELIEHLPNPLQFLRSLAGIARLRAATLIVTTPNATAFHNAAIATLSMESTHHDHLCILSYKTLTTLFRRAGFADYSVIPYRASFAEMRSRNRGARAALVAAGEVVVNAVEWAFPLLSFGFIVRATI